jgi:hypothetical protein
MALMSNVHRGPEVTGVSIVLGETEKLTPYDSYRPNLSLKLSNADNTHLIFSKDLVEIFHIKLNELVRSINVECIIKGFLTITNHILQTQTRCLSILKTGIENGLLQISANDIRQ